MPNASTAEPAGATGAAARMLVTAMSTPARRRKRNVVEENIPAILFGHLAYHRLPGTAALRRLQLAAGKREVKLLHHPVEKQPALLGGEPRLKHRDAIIAIGRLGLPR